ncbi:MAG: PAS domain-containing hybrid sensor histidine kinase/response regulator [Thauera sp.]
MEANPRSTDTEVDFLFANAPCALIEWDTALRVRRWSVGAERVFGWSASEVLGRHADEWPFFHADDRDRARAALIALLDEGAERNPFLCRNQTRAGVLVHTEWQTVVRRDANGQALALLSCITDQHIGHRTEGALDASEVRYRSIFTNSHAAMLILDPQNGRVVDANPAAERFYGWSHAVLTQMHISQVNTLTPEAVRAAMDAAHASRRTHFEFRHRRADGSVRDVEVYSGPTESGDRSLLFSIVHDITERKQAEASSRRWERFFRLSNLGLAIHDATDNTILDVNATYAEQHGYGVEEMRCMQISDLYVPEERALLPARLAEADRCGNISFETEHLRKDGSRLPMVIGVTALQDDAGRTVARFVFGLDISARKAAEEELRKLSRAVEDSPESIVITNTRAEIEYVNKAFVATTGYSREEALGRNPRVLQSGHTTPETYRELWDTVTRGQSWRGEFLNRRKDGTEYLEQVTITPIQDERGQTSHYVAVKQDITEQRHMEEELVRYREHLEGLVASRTIELQHALDAANIANRAKSEFLTTMSHEIRTPMNGVIGLLEVLGHSSLSAEQTELVEIMRESASTLRRLIDDILDFSKIESGNLELDIGPVSLRNLIARVADIMQPVADREAVKLMTRVDQDVPEIISSDALRLQQILFNLVSNAVKFSAGRERPGRVELRAERAGAGLVRFMVTDNGIGIAPEVFEKIFQPFSQAESSTTRRFGGTGLGLSICARLVRMLNGQIDLRSLPGRGTRFIVTLPLTAMNGNGAHAEAGHSPKPASAHTRAEPAPRIAIGDTAAQQQILVAEDNDTNRRVIERQLALLGLRCEMAKDGREALERWRHGRYSLLLTDLHMPEMDGYELTARIRSEEPAGTRMPIIAVTANALRGEDQRCIDAGMDDFVVKPVEIETLRGAIARWMPVPEAETAAPPPPAPAAAAAASDTAPVFDPLRLPGLIGDDATIIEEFLGDYRDSARETAREIRAACDAGNWRRVGDHAHRLKSSSRSVGAMHLGNVCAALEQAGRDGDGPRAEGLVADLEAALNGTLQAMDHARPASILR